MATTQLSLYNEALLLVGERELTTLTDDVEARHRLDTAYENGVDYCLELVNPVFARKTNLLNVYSTSSVHAFDNVFTLPSDYINMVRAYSDEKLDQPVNRYIIEGDELACNYNTIYLRYISNSYALTVWDKSFERVVVAYLASEIAPRIAPDEMERIEATLATRLKQAIDLSQQKEPGLRASDEGATLTTAWRHIYNRALQILGQEEINSNTDDSIRKVKLDVALAADLVESLLEDTGWHWAITSAKIQVNPSLEPDWGFQDVFDKPDDMQRLDGIFVDEYMQVPLKQYKDEGPYIFSNVNEMYVQFVSRAFLTDPNNWPIHFKRLVAAAMARDVSRLPVFGRNAQDIYDITNVFKDAEAESKNTDAMQSPPRIISEGSWTSSRFQGNRYHGRP
ncbi:hypothetical protein OAO65_02270 [Flavobacteriales bacterium]|nr:hypothetical protein [Flavobacteriales bacterium]